MTVRFAQVDKNVFRGGAPIDVEVFILKEYWGITKIVSLDQKVGDLIHKKCEELGIKHIIIPLTTGEDKNVSKIPKEVESWPNYNGNVYVHCRRGCDRTGLVSAFYRILVNNWHLDIALKEAHSFGMGEGLEPEIAESYYKAVKDFHDSYKDYNKADDIVSLERDIGFSGPAANNYNISNPMQQSFAPFLDVEKDYLNRPASRKIQLMSFAQIIIYKCCNLSDILKQNTLWYSTPEQAKNHGSGKLYSSTMDNNAKIKEYTQESNKQLAQIAMINGIDVVLFKSPNLIEYYIIDPNIISNIREITDSNNSDDIPLVGGYDNYQGLAVNVFPGEGGVLPGGGAGMSENPTY